ARLLTPQDYGLLGMAATVTGFVVLFRDFGLDSAAIQQRNLTFSELSTLFWVNAALGAVITPLTLAISPGVAWFYGEPRLTLITAVCSVSFALGGLVVQHEALLRRQMRFKTIATVELTTLFLGYAFAIVLGLHHAGYWALVLSNLAQAFIRSSAF